jgi:hypothetical protein
MINKEEIKKSTQIQSNMKGSMVLIMICVVQQISLFASSLEKNQVRFSENKGQFRDQHGNPNPEVLYMADFGGMKVLIQKDGFSYETCDVILQWVDPVTRICHQTFANNGKKRQ